MSRRPEDLQALATTDPAGNNSRAAPALVWRDDILQHLISIFKWR